MNLRAKQALRCTFEVPGVVSYILSQSSLDLRVREGFDAERRLGVVRAGFVGTTAADTQLSCRATGVLRYIPLNSRVPLAARTARQVENVGGPPIRLRSRKPLL